jgi:5-methylcytosine-specific restriction endonuclease McrA
MSDDQAMNHDLTLVELEARLERVRERRARRQAPKWAPSWFARLAGRDGPVCWYCLLPLSIDIATRDHVMPKSRGGQNCDANYRLACHPCNKAKGDDLPTGWTRGCRAPKKRQHLLQEIPDSGSPIDTE